MCESRRDFCIVQADDELQFISGAKTRPEPTRDDLWKD
jgi:hypothetical protein